MNSWYLYVVKCNDNSLYTGVSTDISRRIREHNVGKRGAKYTRARRPVKLIYSEPYPDRSSAQKEEYRFKQLSKDKKHEFISQKLLEKMK